MHGGCGIAHFLPRFPAPIMTTRYEMPLLHVDQLSWATDNKSIIQDISFAVAEGETVGIIGPNGAGKSTILKCLYQENNIASGNVYFNQHSISYYSKKQLAQQIAVVCQVNEAVFDLTVNDIVNMGLTPHKGLFDLDNDRDRHRIVMALEKVDLLSKKDQLFSTLSGGEQQRCLIARAIVQQPKLLLLDEPTNHLDIYYQHQILSLAKQLNITLLMSIHDLNLAAQYCDKLLLINQGKMVAFDKPAQVLTPELLSQVFKLECKVENNPFTQSLNVIFKPEYIFDKQSE